MLAVARSTRQALPQPPRAVVRRDGGTWALQVVLHRKGLGPVAGVDEAGRGACAGPLVVAACVLRPADAVALAGLTDSKLLTAPRREHYYDLIVTRAVARSVVVVPPDEVDELGVHVANLEGMRRAVAGLALHPGYVLTDGFRVPGLTAPNMAVIGGDRAATASWASCTSRCHGMASVSTRATARRSTTRPCWRMARAPNTGSATPTSCWRRVCTGLAPLHRAEQHG
jgi:ribonuclease HII